MKIFLGKNSIDKFQDSESRQNFIFKANDIFLSSEKDPCLEVPLGDGSVLFVWGKIYALLNQEEVKKFHPDEESISVLKDLYHGNSLESFIQKIEGKYAAVLIEKQSRVTVFSDIYGRTDIFYAQKEESLVASVNLKSIVKVVLSKQYNQVALASLFNLYGNYIPKKQTIYQGVSRLGVLEKIVFEGGKIDLDSFPFTPQSTELYGEEKLKDYSNAMHSAVDIRSSDECNWVYLSSGWDSSSILALLVKLRGASKVRAVINRNKYSDKSGVVNQVEIDRAQKIADYFSVKLDINEIDYSQDDYLQYWDEIRDSLKEKQQFMLHNFNGLRLARHVAKNGSPSHSVFSGEISDGAHNLGFAQFATILDHPDLGFREYSDKMASYLFGPSFFRRILNKDIDKDVVYNFLKSRLSYGSFEDPASMNEKQLKLKFAESFYLMNPRMPFLNLPAKELMTNDGMTEYSNQMRMMYFQDFSENVTAETLYSWMLHLYNSFHWQGMKEFFDNASEFYNLDSSMPFWDSRVQNFLSAMPESWGRGLDLNPTKYPLKWMLKNEVDYPNHLQVGPHSYLYDVDPTWDVNYDILYGTEVAKQYYKEAIKDYKYEELLSDSHFNLGYLKKVTQNYLNDVEASGQERVDIKNLISICLVGWF